MNARIILGLDPSSTRTGYAILETQGAPRIIDAGFLRGKANDPALSRALAMRGSLCELLDEHGLMEAIVEIPSGKVGGGQRRGASASAMAIYGMAVGIILGTCIERLGTHVRAVDERTWTRRVPKRIRQRRVVAEFKGYREVAIMDGGADVADAIGLALWGIGH